MGEKILIVLACVVWALLCFAALAKKHIDSLFGKSKELGEK